LANQVVQISRTPTLEKMIREGRGYRTETFSGSKIRKIADIIRGEISFGNTDVIEYLQKNCNILKDYVYDRTIPGRIYFDYIDFCIENAPHIAAEIEAFLKEVFRVEDIDDLEGIWLTDHENVVTLYGGTDNDIDEYLIPDENFIVISDLGIDGSLFVFNVNKENIIKRRI
jgi:hypothetical protein